MTPDAYSDVVSFGRWLVDSEGWTAAELQRYYEHPHRWQEERTDWLLCRKLGMEPTSLSELEND